MNETQKDILNFFLSLFLLVVHVVITWVFIAFDICTLFFFRVTIKFFKNEDVDKVFSWELKVFK